MNDSSFYERIVRPILFSVSGETAHNLVMGNLKALHTLRLSPLLGKLCEFDHPALKTSCFGLSFRNPIGLAAGFDKDAVLPELWPLFGFGHVELGTVTALPQAGNPKPRLFRLQEDRAIINRMGFNNIGASAFKTHFAKKRQDGLPRTAVYGINIGKSKVTPLELAAQDYAQTFTALAPLADYVTINVSSPNTPGLRQLQGKDELTAILEAVTKVNARQRPILLKIAPDLTLSQIDEIIELAAVYGVSGLIATNTTLGRDGLHPSPYSKEAGGLSGAPLKARSTDIIRYISKATQGRLAVVGVGGIETAEDAYDKILAGACLVQVYTGFIYHGPLMVKAIKKGLVALLERDGFRSIREAVGAKV